MAHESAAAEAESALRLREDAVVERMCTLAYSEATAQRLEQSLRLREEEWWERNGKPVDRKSEVSRREAVARRHGEQLAKREEANAGREQRHLENARTEQAALEQRVTKLEAQEKELATSAYGGVVPMGEGELAEQLTVAADTIAGLHRALQERVEEVKALWLANEVGPGMLRDAFVRLDRTGHRVGISLSRDPELPSSMTALTHRIGEMAEDLERLPEVVKDTVKSSSVVELVLASYHARDPDFLRWLALEDSPLSSPPGRRRRSTKLRRRSWGTSRGLLLRSPSRRPQKMLTRRSTGITSSAVARPVAWVRGRPPHRRS